MREDEYEGRDAGEPEDVGDVEEAPRFDGLRRVEKEHLVSCGGVFVLSHFKVDVYVFMFETF